MLDTPGLSDHLVAPEAIRNNRRGWNQGSSRPRLNFRVNEPFDFGEHDMQGVVSVIGLNGSNERDFVLRAASGLTTGVFASKVGIINLDAT